MFHRTVCSCHTCVAMSASEREAFLHRQRELRSKGGKTRSQQPSADIARRKGGVRTYNDAIMSGDPLRIARVKHFCRDHNVAKASALGIHPAKVRKQQVAITQELLKKGIIVRDNA